MNREYFTRYCGRAPYEQIWLEHSGATNCVATLRRIRAPIGSALVLGVLSMSSLLVIAGILLGADFGSPVGVGLLVVSGVAAATSSARSTTSGAAARASCSARRCWRRATTTPT